MGRKSSGGGWGAIVVVLVAIAVVVMAVMWTLSLFGHVVGLTPTYDEVMNRDKQWLHEHYPNVGWRYAITAVLLLLASVGVFRAINWLGRAPAERTALTARRFGTGLAIAFVALLGIRATIGSPSVVTTTARTSEPSALAEQVASADDQDTEEAAAATARERRAERRREARRRAERRRRAEALRAERRRRAEARAT